MQTRVACIACRCRTYTAPHCLTLPHTASHCLTLPHTAPHSTSYVYCLTLYLLACAGAYNKGATRAPARGRREIADIANARAQHLAAQEGARGRCVGCRSFMSLGIGDRVQYTLDPHRIPCSRIYQTFNTLRTRVDAELNEVRSRMEQQDDALMRNPLSSSSLSDTPGVVCGVGVTFQKSGGGFLVSGLEACGEEVLQMGDLTLAIDDVPLAHVSSVEFRENIQGPAGTRVSLLIVRQHSSHGATMPPFDLVVTRRAWMSAPVAALPHQLPSPQAQQPEADLVRWVNRPDSTIGITPLMISAFRPNDAAILPHHHHQQNAPNSMPAGSADDYTPSPFAHTGVASHEAHHQAQYDVLAQVGAHQGTPQGTHDDDLVAHQGTYYHAEVPKTVSVETRVSVETHGRTARSSQSHCLAHCHE